MEKYVKISQILPIEQYTYEDKNGQQQIFKHKGFVLHNGNNAFFCEAKGRYAETLESRTYDTTQWYVADFNISIRRYSDRDGNNRISNEIELTRLNLV